MNLAARGLFDPVESRPEQRLIPTKLVDDKPGHTRLVADSESGERAEKMCQHSPAIDVTDDEHGEVCRFGEAHVGDIAVAKVDLRSRAGALADHDVESRAKFVEGIGDDRAQMSAPLVIVRCANAPGHATAHDDLRAAI